MSEIEYSDDGKTLEWCPGDLEGTFVIPSTVTKIGVEAFWLQTGLTHIHIPDSVTEIADRAFADCSGLTSIEIPASVEYIGIEAFEGCSGLTSIKVAPGNATYDSRNDCNAIIRTARNSLEVGCATTVIPDSVLELGDGAFAGCKGLTSIVIPSSVTGIGIHTFKDCTGLKSIMIPDSVREIGDWAFQGCSGLTIKLTESLDADCSPDVFDGATGLKLIIRPDALSPEEMLEKAKEIARKAHKYQTDLDGNPVILHPMAVADMGDTVEEQICGWLHDVLEDSDCTPFDLLAEGISEEIVDTLQLLTHDKSEPYDDYVLRIARSGNRLAITTKLHDLQHNLARGRAGGHQKQVEKHSRVLPIIEQAYAELTE